MGQHLQFAGKGLAGSLTRTGVQCWRAYVFALLDGDAHDARDWLHAELLHGLAGLLLAAALLGLAVCGEGTGWENAGQSAAAGTRAGWGNPPWERTLEPGVFGARAGAWSTRAFAS